MIRNTIIILIILVGIALVVFAGYQLGSINRLYREDVARSFKQKSVNPGLLTEDDIRTLPESVQKYFRYTGVIGKPKVVNFKIAFYGQFKMSPQQDWLKIKAEQYDFVKEFSRIFYMEASMFGLPVNGRDLYEAGKGNMLIKVAGIFPVADIQGLEMQKSGLATLFNDMCLMAPATLIDPRIRWETIDTKTVKGTLTDNGISVTAVLYFDEQGKLLNFTTNDRYYAPVGSTPKQVRWSTPINSYAPINGLNLTGSADAVWQLPEGDFTYAKFIVNELTYNTESKQ